MKQQEIILEDNHAIQSPSELYSFSQILTSSEISTLGGLYIPKEHAERCFPPLVCFGDMFVFNLSSRICCLFIVRIWFVHVFVIGYDP